MKTNKNSIIIAIALISFIIVISVIAAFGLSRIQKKDHKTSVQLDQRIVDDLKNNLGKGSAGDVIAVEQRTNAEGNRIYEYHYKDGSSQTVTVRPARDGEEGSRIEPGEPIEDGEEERQSQSEETSGPESETQKENPAVSGTVFERFSQLSAEEKYAFYLTFDDPEDYLAWYEASEAEYLSLHPTIVVKPGDVIDLGD